MRRLLDVNALLELLDGSPELPVINVLPESSYRRAHVPGSINVPVDEEGFEARIRARLPAGGGPVVLYGDSAHCDACRRASEGLERAGLGEVMVFAGGTAAWQRARLPVETGRPVMM